MAVGWKQTNLTPLPGGEPSHLFRLIFDRLMKASNTSHKTGRWLCSPPTPPSIPGPVKQLCKVAVLKHHPNTFAPSQCWPRSREGLVWMYDTFLKSSMLPHSQHSPICRGKGNPIPKQTSEMESPSTKLSDSMSCFSVLLQVASI